MPCRGFQNRERTSAPTTTGSNHAAKGLMTAYENIQAAESRIRDADMAEEMVDFTKNHVLVQSGTAMLAQANLQSQSVLRLLGAM